MTTEDTRDDKHPTRIRTVLQPGGGDASLLATPLPPRWWWSTAYAPVLAGHQGAVRWPDLSTGAPARPVSQSSSPRRPGAGARCRRRRRSSPPGRRRLGPRGAATADCVGSSLRGRESGRDRPGRYVHTRHSVAPPAARPAPPACLERGSVAAGMYRSQRPKVRVPADSAVVAVWCSALHWGCQGLNVETVSPYARFVDDAS